MCFSGFHSKSKLSVSVVLPKVSVSVVSLRNHVVAERLVSAGIAKEVRRRASPKRFVYQGKRDPDPHKGSFI